MFSSPLLQEKSTTGRTLLLLQVFTSHFPSFHGGAIKSALHRGWGCTGSTWQIEICGLRNLAFRLGWVVLNIDHPPLCQKKSMVICLASFCIFWGDGFLENFEDAKTGRLLSRRDLFGKKGFRPTKMSLRCFFFRWNWPQFKTGVFKVNRKYELKHEMPPNNSELDVQKSIAISSWVVLPKDIFLIFTLGNWSNLRNIFEVGWHHLVAIFMMISSWNGSIDWIWSGGASDVLL